MSQTKIVFFLPSLRIGGAERATVQLIRGLSPQSFDLEVVIAQGDGQYHKDLPASVKVTCLHVSKLRYAIFKMFRHLRSSQPDLAVGVMAHTNIALGIAARLAKLARVWHGKVVYSIRVNVEASPDHQSLLGTLLCRWLYASAFRVIAVSDGVARSAERRYFLPEGSVQTTHNAVFREEIVELSQTELDHPWMSPQEVSKTPVMVGVGRLEQQKDFKTLIAAFALLNEKVSARLVLLGDGGERNNLEAFVKQLKVEEQVHFHGACSNPYTWLAKASCFVLSSRYEGLPNALIEAMACGCPVVATDCPSGPREILVNGEYGKLVKVRDVQSLSEAMLATLKSPIASEVLQERARAFSTENAVNQFLKAISP